MGKGKSGSSSEEQEHVSRPLHTLKDPSAFGPPPKNVNYHGGAAVPDRTTPDPRGLGAPRKYRSDRKLQSPIYLYLRSSYFLHTHSLPSEVYPRALLTSRSRARAHLSPQTYPPSRRRRSPKTDPTTGPLPCEHNGPRSARPPFPTAPYHRAVLKSTRRKPIQSPSSSLDTSHSLHSRCQTQTESPSAPAAA